MVIDNSGKIYEFKLEHNLGYAYCQFNDFTDIVQFNGKLSSVFNIIKKDKESTPSIEQIISSPILFGPNPLFKFPNARGKGAWKFIGQIIMASEPEIVFKDVRDNYTKKDWTKLNGWFYYKNFLGQSNDCDYEEVRHFELPILYGMRAIETRTTMQLLLLDKKNIADYYNLTDFDFRHIYIQTVNTSFSLEEANKLLEIID
jgi:hypothetical protein